MSVRWWQVAWRMLLVQIVIVLVIGAPVAAILLVGSPLNPWTSAPAWSWGGVAWRLLAALAYLSIPATLSGIASTRASHNLNNPFDVLASSIRRIASRDFKVRIEPPKAREPREMARLSHAFNDMAAELQRSEELRNNMMADVSHELRTPLTALEGNLRAALDHVYPLDDDTIASLYGQTRHLIRLVNDLHELALADARQLPLVLAPADLAALICETAQIFEPLAEERGVTLQVAESTLPAITLDEARIRQVLHNLLSNALRHTPRGGTIRVTSSRDGADVVIAVADTGDGLEPDQLDAVFGRFYRTDKSRSRDTGGTGLGLAIAGALVAMHGGSIVAASGGRGLGSTFTIRLPG